jgi:hypothetical protein
MRNHEHAGDGAPDYIHNHAWRRAFFLSAVTSFVLGAVGNYQYLASEAEGPSWGNALYHTAQLFILHSPHFEKHVPWSLEVARWLAPFTTIVGLCSAGVRMFREETARFVVRHSKGHVVVCGVGRRGLALVRHLRSRTAAPRVRVVVIDAHIAPDAAVECRRWGAYVLPGDATRREVRIRRNGRWRSSLARFTRPTCS